MTDIDKLRKEYKDKTGSTWNMTHEWYSKWLEKEITEARAKLKNNGDLGDVSESNSFDIHNCINQVCDAVHSRFHLYGQIAKSDGSFRWRVKQAIDKMLYSR